MIPSPNQLSLSFGVDGLDRLVDKTFKSIRYLPLFRRMLNPNDIAFHLDIAIVQESYHPPAR